MRLLVGLFLAALSVAGFASTFVFGAELTKACRVSPEVLSFLRFAIAGGVMLAFVRRVPRSSVDWRDLLTLGPIGTTVMAWCVFEGCARVSAANASMADALTPLMIFCVAAIRTRRVAVGQLVGLFAGFLGALLVIQVVSPRGVSLSAYSIGDLFIALAAATWGVYTVYGHRAIVRMGSRAFTTWTMLVGAAALGVFLPFMDLAWPATPKAWGLVVLLGLVSTLMPFWAWNAAQKYLSMSLLAVTAYFTPIFAVALAWAFLGEPATPFQWVGTVFIVFSALVETRRDSGAPAGKDAIRAVMKARRRAVSPAQRTAAGRELADRLLSRSEILAALASRRPIAVYLPGPDEVDLLPFLEKVLERGGVLLAPRWTGSDYALAPLRGLSSAEIRKGPHGIAEPAERGRASDDLEPAVWLVPGLAFTAEGVRLGFGGGWYDRLLAADRGPSVRFGIAYEFQIVPQLPAEPHDVRLSDIISARCS